jgi:hypothetical protein
MSIPLTGKPVKIEIDGVIYSVKVPTGETEIDIMELQDTLPKNKKEREALFTDKKREASQYIDRFVDLVLCGWQTKTGNLPPFPSRPSQCLKSTVKIQILSFYNNEKALSEADLKNF